MIEFKNISLRYNNKYIMRDVSFEIKRGEKVVVSGKSGLGKSSLFAMLLGFAESTDGEVLFEGITVDAKNSWDIRKKIAYVDQDVSLGEGKVSELFDFVFNLKINKPLDFKNETTNELFKYFDLSRDVFDKDISELSGGERQRLAVIISILLNRNVFLLDEVTSALDKHLKKRVADYFIKRKDLTVITISHDPVWIDNPLVKIFDLEEGKWK